MNRRHLFKTTLGLLAGTYGGKILAQGAGQKAANVAAPAQAATGRPEFTQLLINRPGWANYDFTMKLKFSTVKSGAVGKEAASTLWVPLPSVTGDYQRLIAEPVFKANTSFILLKSEPRYGSRFLQIQSPGAGAPVSLDLAFRVRTVNRSINTAQTGLGSISVEEAAIYRRPTQLSPLTGLVQETAEYIIGKTFGAQDRARAIYNWVVKNSSYDDKISRHDSGDVYGMLVEDNLAGGSIDISSLFVGLARAVGVPSRIVTGLWVGPSRSAYPSLGIGGDEGDISSAHHCRAEFFDQMLGWVPVDPASVRRAMFYDQGNATSLDANMQAFASRMFGNWDMNWVGLNYAQDLDLPESKQGVLPYFIYPVAEMADSFRDGKDPNTFSYSLTVKPLKV